MPFLVSDLQLVIRQIDTKSHNCYTKIMDAPRETMTISLPPALKAKVDDLINQGDYGTASEYFRDLVRQDIKRRTKEELEARLLESLDSEDPTPLTKKDFDDIRAEIRHRASLRSKKSPK